MLPNFILCGAVKCGTTWLYDVLKQHRDIYLPPYRSEVRFFDENYHRGLDFYASKYRDWQGEKAIGDLSPSYMLNDEIPRRIHEALPEVKILFLLREPVDRAISSYIYSRSVRFFDISFQECLEKKNRTITDSFYFEKIKNYYDYFPREQIKILLFDDLIADPDTFLASLFDFLGVDTSEVENISHEKKSNESVIPKNYLLYRSMMRVVNFLRKFNSEPVDRLIEGVKKTGIKQRLSDPAQRSAYPAEEFKMAEGLYNEDIGNLEKLTGMDLSRWLR